LLFLLVRVTFYTFYTRDSERELLMKQQHSSLFNSQYLRALNDFRSIRFCNEHLYFTKHGSI